VEADLGGVSLTASFINACLSVIVFPLESILLDDGTHLDLELGVESRSSRFLGLTVFRVLPPRPQRFLARKLDDRHALHILCPEGLEAYEPGRKTVTIMRLLLCFSLTLSVKGVWSIN
jgi:hypothetical protein